MQINPRRNDNFSVIFLKKVTALFEMIAATNYQSRGLPSVISYDQKNYETKRSSAVVTLFMEYRDKIAKMFTASRHISDIYTKPLTEDVNTNENENNGKPREESANESTKRTPKKPKKVVKFESSKKKFEEVVPTPDIAFQMIEKEVKMKQKRETPGKKGTLFRSY